LIGQILKYFVLGAAIGTADRSSSDWVRLGRERRRRAEAARALRYLLDHYQPASFEEDCAKPEFRSAVLAARDHLYRTRSQAAERKLEEILTRIQPAETGRPHRMERARRWLGREKIRPMPLRGKVILAVAVVLALDVWTLLAGGLGAGLSALLLSIVEVPALLCGLALAPAAGRAASRVLHSLGASADPQAEIDALTAQIERQKRSLHLRLMAPALPLPEPGLQERGSLPPPR
jgi:hypothetical protein